MNYRSKLFFVPAICVLLFLRVQVIADDTISQEKYDCPDENAAFVTTCSGAEESGNGPNRDDIASDEKDSGEIFIEEENADPSDGNEFDDLDIVNEVLGESSQQKAQHSSQQTCTDQNQFNSDVHHGKDESESLDTNAIRNLLEQTIATLTHKYYDPLPPKAKCAVGSICGFASSRITLGVANRIFRLTGAIWVASEVLHTSGFCDENACVPEEMRPWVGILRRVLIKQCMRVRLMARKIYNQDRIREIARKDGMFAGGFASGAFIGFVV